MIDKEINPEMEKELCKKDCKHLNSENSVCDLWDEKLNKCCSTDRYLKLFSCQFDDLKTENKILRELLWSHHGHMGIYGDDGEMQCSECQDKYGFWDYKRTPAKEMQDKMMAYDLFQINKKQEVRDAVYDFRKKLQGEIGVG